MTTRKPPGKKNTSTGMRWICRETNQRGHRLYRVEIQRNGVRYVKRFLHCDEALEWRDMMLDNLEIYP